MSLRSPFALALCDRLAMACPVSVFMASAVAAQVAEEVESSASPVPALVEAEVARQLVAAPPVAAAEAESTVG